MHTLPVIVQWIVLLILSASAAAFLEYSQLPAAALIGSMIAGIAVGIGGGSIEVPRKGFTFAQSIIGCVIASSLSPAIFPAFAQNWLIFVIAVIATVAASSLLGLLISRWKILPGTVGVWGSAPGAATAMVLMAGAFGADQRLVAFMQYLRVIMVSVGAALIAGLWIDADGVRAAEPDWFPAIQPLAFGATIFVAIAGARIGRLARVPSPEFLGALILGAVLHLVFNVDFQIPKWLATFSFALVGWTIGLKFRSETLRQAARALPQIVLSILALMAFCGGIAFVLANEMGIDPLTAYLATSPGGMDTVAIVAVASGSADISFIMTMQALRFLFVLIVGPPIARLVASWVKP